MGDTTAVLKVSSAWLRRKKVSHELEFGTFNKKDVPMCKSYYAV